MSSGLRSPAEGMATLRERRRRGSTGHFNSSSGTAQHLQSPRGTEGVTQRAMLGRLCGEGPRGQPLLPRGCFS